MIVADKLKTKNRAEYLLYLWQVEDIIRAYGADEERLKHEYVSRFNLDSDKRCEVEQWYTNLCEMVRSEGHRQSGHLQICQNILQELSELHARLTASTHFPYYREMYYKVLPYIVEVRGKNNKEQADEPELQTLFDILYGVILLRLQKKAVSPDTERAVKDISALLGQLSDYYFKDKQEPLEF